VHRRDVEFAMFAKPGFVASIGMFLNLPKELNRLRFVARFGGIVPRNDHLHIHRDYVAIRVNQSRPFDAFIGNRHCQLLSKK
jgi:hypothetical protein